MRYATKISEYFFSGPNAFFLIPLYQRTYAWDKDNCKRLFDDLVKVHKKNLKSHFFGSIVSIKENEIDDDLLIIDGQQRLTTITLIILVLRNAIMNKALKCDCEEEFLDRIKYYLYAPYRRVDRKIKLRPIEKDRKAFDALYTNDEKQFVPNCGITENYYRFYEWITTSGLTADDFLESLEKLFIIDLKLESTDNPQLIFESLNSTGKDLTEADKVRNYLLMDLSKQCQDDYYHAYWSKIENCTDGDPTMFIRDYLIIKLKRICNIDNLYFDFKEFDENNSLGREEFLKDLLKYAEYDEIIRKGKTGKVKLDKKLNQIASLGSSLAMPFYLAFYDYAISCGMPEDSIYSVFDTTENYWARRIICGYPANALQKLYATLHNDILRIFNVHIRRKCPLDSKDYSEVMKFILLRKQGLSTFPGDSELDDFFMTRQIYKLPVDYKYFLFERMENLDSKEGMKPIIKGMKEGTITIEHIMPQTLTPQWKTALGPEWERIYEKYLNTFANLTLTGYNSNYSNHSFADKKNGYTDKKGEKIYGYKESGFTLSNFLKECDKWTEDEMIAREKILLEHFKGLWPMIKTSYQPLEKEVDSVSFADDDYDLTNRKISAFSYKGSTHNVLTWKDMFVQLCQIIYEQDKSTMTFLSGKNYYVYNKESEGMSKVADNCYIYSSCSTDSKMNALRYIFTSCNISETDLEFHLVPLIEKESDSEE